MSISEERAIQSASDLARQVEPINGVYSVTPPGEGSRVSANWIVILNRVVPDNVVQSPSVFIVEVDPISGIAMWPGF